MIMIVRNMWHTMGQAGSQSANQSCVVAERLQAVVDVIRYFVFFFATTPTTMTIGHWYFRLLK